MPAVPAGSGNPQHTIPLACALTCFWLLLLIHATFGQKPAKLPLVGREPFIAAWNAPLDMCAIKYNVTANLNYLFHIRGSPRAINTGQDVTIFYANRLGRYPYYTDHGLAVNGGLPQNCSLDTHLEKAYLDISHFIPSPDFRGLAVIDWEYWRPQWSRNWDKKDIYRSKSRELTERAYINVEATQVEQLARHRFERSARVFMEKTVQLGTRLRPQGLWGYYLYPDCHNYNQHEHNYTGFCPPQESHRNNELHWLWNSSTALFPSVAIRKSHSNSIGNLHFSQHRIQESLRIASLTWREYDLPTFVYLRLGYRDEAMAFLSTKDLIHTIGESAALGAAGFVIWGDLNLTSSRDNCTKVKEFLGQRLGQYITNVTRAAEVCSDFLCQNNGRCVRREPRAPHYLHLSADSYHIRPSGDGDFVVTGWHSQHQLQLLAQRFRCHCYEGHGGEKCDSLNEVVFEEDGEERKAEEDEKVMWSLEEQGKDEEERQEEEGNNVAAKTSNNLAYTLILLVINVSLVGTVVR